MQISRIIEALERLAPLCLQEEYDNAGLQVGSPDVELTKILVCLDITEAVVDEAIAGGYNLILSHHPLIFRPLRQVSGAVWQQRCVIRAIRAGLVLYAAHTNLDNAPGGVNHEMAARMGLRELRFLLPRPDGRGGSGLVGELPAPVSRAAWLEELRRIFGVQALRYAGADGPDIRRVALCGGAGAFLLADARRAGADCFVTGEFHYHDFFDGEGLLLIGLGHYESEQYTQDLLRNYLLKAFPDVEVALTRCCTNPIRVLR